jgi:hypothetical protein
VLLHVAGVSVPRGPDAAVGLEDLRRKGWDQCMSATTTSTPPPPKKNKASFGHMRPTRESRDARGTAIHQGALVLTSTSALAQLDPEYRMRRKNVGDILWYILY